MSPKVAAVWGGTALWLAVSAASAHIEVMSGPGFANKSQEVTFSVGHGCSGADTKLVRIEIPAAVTSVRVEASNLGPATVETNDAGLVTAVVWQKPVEQVLPADTQFYKLAIRIKVPDQAFTTLFFPAHQTCRAADGTETVVDWVGTMPSDMEGGPEPAPALHIVPPRVPGWNKFTAPVAIDDLATFFGDAVIVWKGNAAYSVNPNTTQQIANTPGVSALAGVAANDEIWVKY
jgi:uncharacterized protein YcnI